MQSNCKRDYYSQSSAWKGIVTPSPFPFPFPLPLPSMSPILPWNVALMLAAAMKLSWNVIEQFQPFVAGVTSFTPLPRASCAMKREKRYLSVLVPFVLMFTYPFFCWTRWAGVYPPARHAWWRLWYERYPSFLACGCVDGGKEVATSWQMKKPCSRISRCNLPSYSTCPPVSLGFQFGRQDNVVYISDTSRVFFFSSYSNSNTESYGYTESYGCGHSHNHSHSHSHSHR